MNKKITLFAFIATLAFMAFKTVPVKADTVTAKNMVPVLRAMYNVDQAESILRDKKAAFKACRKNKVSALEMALAQAAVTDATNLVNTLNGLVARDTDLIKAAPANVVNPSTFATNSLAAQGAWNDFIYRERAGHALVIPSSPVPTAAQVSLASRPYDLLLK